MLCFSLGLGGFSLCVPESRFLSGFWYGLQNSVGLDIAFHCHLLLLYIHIKWLHACQAKEVKTKHEIENLFRGIYMYGKDKWDEKTIGF